MAMKLLFKQITVLVLLLAFLQVCRTFSKACFDAFPRLPCSFANLYIIYVALPCMDYSIQLVNIYCVQSVKPIRMITVFNTVHLVIVTLSSTFDLKNVMTNVYHKTGETHLQIHKSFCKISKLIIIIDLSSDVIKMNESNDVEFSKLAFPCKSLSFKILHFVSNFNSSGHIIAEV